MWYVVIALLASGAVNCVYAYIFVGAITLFFVQMIKCGKVYINAAGGYSLWALFLFGISYTLIGMLVPQGLVRYSAAPVLAFTTGWIICETDRGDQIRTIANTILVIALLYGIHASLNYFINIGRTRWSMRDFFSGLNRSATGLGSLGTPIFSLVGYFLFFEKRKTVKLFWLVVAFFALRGGLQLGTRTQFVILLFTMVVNVFLYCWEKNGVKGIKTAVAIIAVTGLCGWLMYQYNIFGIRDIIDSSTLMLRLLDTSNAQIRSDRNRLEQFFGGIVALIEHPFGGLIEETYFHNMWLDVARVSGIIPFISICIFTVFTVRTIWWIFENKRIDKSSRYIILSFNLGILLNFFVEPILEGMLDMFLTFCLVAGMTEAFRVTYKYRNVLPAST